MFSYHDPGSLVQAVPVFNPVIQMNPQKCRLVGSETKDVKKREGKNAKVQNRIFIHNMMIQITRNEMDEDIISKKYGRISESENY